MKRVRLYLFLITVGFAHSSCGGNIENRLTRDEFSAKWGSSKNNSAESWWYAGVNNHAQYFVIKKPLTETIVSVKERDVKLINIDKFRFTKDKGKWVNIKRENLAIEK